MHIRPRTALDLIEKVVNHRFKMWRVEKMAFCKAWWGGAGGYVCKSCGAKHAQQGCRSLAFITVAKIYKSELSDEVRCVAASGDRRFLGTIYE